MGRIGNPGILLTIGLLLLSACTERESARVVTGEESLGPFNVILFIGDGMGENHRRAARWATVGPDGSLSMDRMPVTALVRTSSGSDLVTDSAAAATAMACGIKTVNGYLGIDGNHSPRVALLEDAQQMGMAVGLVTTTQLTHATPAAFVAKTDDRFDVSLIAEQMVNAGVEVLLGGGEREFLPYTTRGVHGGVGTRADGRDLIAEARDDGYFTVFDEPALAAIDSIDSGLLLGLFAAAGMNRPFSPSLATMTRQAIEFLSRDPDGFFLMVEGGLIDGACHGRDAENAIGDTIGLDEAVEAAISFAEIQGNTLIVVVGDHETGGITLSLEPTGDAEEDGPFEMPSGADFFVNWATSGHTSREVPLTAGGPGADAFPAELENNLIHDVLLDAMRSRAAVGQ